MPKNTQQRDESLTSPMIFVSREWLSERWGISQPTIIRMEQRGELKPVHLGLRLVRYRREDIEALEAKASK